jgi:hypothetical protein
MNKHLLDSHILEAATEIGAPIEGSFPESSSPSGLARASKAPAKARSERAEVGPLAAAVADLPELWNDRDGQRSIANFSAGEPDRTVAGKQHGPADERVIAAASEAASKSSSATVIRMGASGTTPSDTVVGLSQPDRETETTISAAMPARPRIRSMALAAKTRSAAVSTTTSSSAMEKTISCWAGVATMR